MFVVMDTFNFPLHAPKLCTDDDGDTLVFDAFSEAEAFGKENCQSYQVVPVGKTVVSVLVENDSFQAKAKCAMPIELRMHVYGDCPGEEAQAMNEKAYAEWDAIDLPVVEETY